MLIAAAVTDLAEAMGTDQREALGHHAGRAEELADYLDPIGGKAGFLLQLLDRRILDALVVLVADQAGGKLEAFAAAEGHSPLLDQHHLALMFGQDHHGAHAAAAFDIFPPSVADDADIFALPFHRAAH